MAVTGRSADESAYVRLQTVQVVDTGAWNARFERGLLRVSTIIRLVIGFSARTGEGGRMLFEVPRCRSCRSNVRRLRGRTRCGSAASMLELS